jgi:hypothetical protein
MKHAVDRTAGLEVETVDGVLVKVGRDPRKMTQVELTALGHSPLSVLQALRARCIDCCAGQTVEVRRCVSVNCPSWPFRMSWNPWRDRSQPMSEERRAKMAETLARARAVKAAVSP